MYKQPYDATRQSLYHPGEADNFFEFDLEQTNDQTLCAEMSRLAYVKKQDKLKTNLARAKFNLHCSIGYETNGTQLFIATRQEQNGSTVVIVALRGTEQDDPTDLLADAKLSKTSWVDASGQSLGQVHKGFADALLNENILVLLVSELNKFADQSPRILLTGHSLGAALATLTATYLNQTSLTKNIHLYTFGSPRVGDEVFVQQMSLVNHQRYVNCCDLVTRIPPENLDYRHSGILHYINRHGHLVDSIDKNAVAEDRQQAAAAYLTSQSYLKGTVWVRELADHSPINYLSGVAGLRA